MADASRHDAWRAGDSYDGYMGRWSRKVAPRFLDWLGLPTGLDWLDVGCGTGALTEAILAQAGPASLIAIDASDGFIATANERRADDRVAFRVGDAQALDLEAASRDVIVSGLMLNFVPDRGRAVAEMARVARPGGVIGWYVWDYPGGGLEFLRAFWTEAAALDPDAATLAEHRRFPDVTPERLTRLASAAGLAAVDCAPIEIETTFRDFDDFWRPFTLGAGPAPGYCASLDPAARARLGDRLRASLPYRDDGAIPLRARAWALRATAP